MGDEGSTASVALVALAAWVIGLGCAGAVCALCGSVRSGRIALAGVFVALSLLATPPLIAAFAGPLGPLVLPWLLPVLLVAPVTFHVFIQARLSHSPAAPEVPRRRLAAPALGALTAAGYMLLPHAHRRLMLVEGELPLGAAPAILALATFGLLLAWPIISGFEALAVMRRLAHYRLQLRDRFSTIDQMEMRWVEAFMALVVVVWIATAAALVSDNILSSPVHTGELLLLLTGVLLLVLICYSLKPQPALPFEPLPSGDRDGAASDPAKYARSAMTRDQALELADRIRSAMIQDGLYREPNLSLARLARRVGAPPNLVSQALNDTLGRSFFDYVNDQRIDTALVWLRDTDRSVLDIAIEAGFNSRSTFYKAFKSRTGQTPLEFRQGSN